MVVYSKIKRKRGVYMRLELRFELEKKFFQADFRKIFISYIKYCLTKYQNGQLYEKFYKDTISKNFSFSVIFQKPIYKKEIIELGGNNLTVIVSSDDRDNTGLYLFSSFIAQKNVKFVLPQSNSMVLKNITQRHEIKIEHSKIILRTVAGSGLCIRQHSRIDNKDTYYVYNDDGFLNQLKLVLSEQALNAGFMEKQVQHINFKPVSCKKVVAKHYGTYIDLTVGMFAMEADPQILQYFYTAGMGSRHSSGFGLVDLVTDDCI